MINIILKPIIQDCNLPRYAHRLSSPLYSAALGLWNWRPRTQLQAEQVNDRGGWFPVVKGGQ